MASTAEFSRRVDYLSRPKRVPSGFLEDRRSVYWLDYHPPGAGPNGTTESILTPRQEQLVRPKRDYSRYVGDRPTPIWAVSEGARKAEATPRVQYLASSRPLHSSYKIERSVYTDVTPAAQSAEATPRLITLSEPKPHRMWVNNVDELLNVEFNYPISTVTPAARNANCSGRVEALANAKATHTLYQPEKPVQWPVADNALKCVATLRLQQLSRPKSRAGLNDDYDPYKVTTGARLARATARVSELAEPIPRKVRQKKAA